MFLLLYGRHVCVPPKGTNMALFVLLLSSTIYWDQVENFTKYFQNLPLLVQTLLRIGIKHYSAMQLIKKDAGTQHREESREYDEQRRNFGKL